MGSRGLWSIWEFLDDMYPCLIEGKKVYFSKLPASQKRAIMDYPLQVTAFDDADDDYLRELFVRLQLGLLLNTGERLHAATGKMKDFIFLQVSKHKFIQHLGLSARRFSKETLAAQISINSFSLDKTNQFSRTRYEDLSSFFNEYADPKGADLERFDVQTRTIINHLDTLWDCFGSETKNLKNRSYILSIYLFVDHRGLKDGEGRQFVDFIFRLWTKLREEAKKGMNRENSELYAFQSMLSSAPGEPYQIEGRDKKLIELFEFFKKHRRIKGDQ